MKCDHIYGCGYLNYFEEDDNHAVLLNKIDIQTMKNRFGDITDLVAKKFIFCPICGDRLEEIK